MPHNAREDLQIILHETQRTKDIVQDLLSFAMWGAGFFGNAITWRSRRFIIDKSGRFQSQDRGLERTNEIQR